MFRDGRIVYLIDITLSPERFVVLLQNQKYLKNWLAAIVDRSNHFVARLPDAEGTKLGQPASKGWQSAIERNRSGVVYHVATDGHRIIDGYTHTAYGWTVGIGIRVDLEARLVFLNRGQGWVVRKLREMMPRIPDDALYVDLAHMLSSHVANITLANSAIA